MSIEQKIAQILAESHAAQNKSAEVVSEEIVEEVVEEIAEEVVAEEAKEGAIKTDGVTSVSGDDEANKKNNVDQQTGTEGKAKAANVVNKGAVAPEASHLTGIKEDVDALISGEELSEEFKEKAAVIFEAAVTNRVKQEIARLDEAYEVALSERVEELKEGLVEKVDGYLDYIVEQWLEQNEIALERGMKSEILEGFVGGLKSLFEEHYIEVPEEKFDVLGSLEEEVTGLKAMLDEQYQSNVELNSKIAQFERARIVAEQTEGLAETDKEKFLSLAEELVYEEAETFEKKVKTIRESYFTNKATATTVVVESVVTDTPVTIIESAPVAPSMKNYLQVLDNLK